MSREIVLSTTNLSVVKGQKRIIHVPHFSLAEGEFVAITGPNGAGKSTLLQALALLEPGAAGEISFWGRPVNSADEILGARRRMAVVFQEPLLLRGSVRYNVVVGLKLRGTARSAAAERVEYWLAKLKISHLANRDVRTLSGGEAQRVNLARAMVLEPDVLFMDEPFTYLDMPTKAALVSELKEILGETGTAALMVSHDLSDIPYLASRMIIMIDGSIVQDGPPEEILNYPETRRTAEFLGIENLWGGFISGSGEGSCRITMGEGVTPINIVSQGRAYKHNMPTVGQVLVCIRPECVSVSVGGSDTASDGGHPANVFHGVIEAVYPMGYYYRVKVWAGYEITAITSLDAFPQSPKRGDMVNVYLPPERIHLIMET